MTRAWRPVVAALAALCVLPETPLFAQTQTDRFVIGVQRFQRGEYTEAVFDLEEAVKQHPDWETAWYYLGVCQFEIAFQNLGSPAEPGAKDYGPARASLTKALQMAPSRPGIRLYLGRIAEDAGNLTEAGRLYREELSLKRVVDKNAVNVALARVAYKGRRYNDAELLLKEVLRSEPKFVEAMYWLGRTFTATQKYDEAIEQFKAASKILNDWLDEVYHLLRVEYSETDPGDPQKVTRIVEDWDQLRKELWALRNAKARPATKTLEQLAQTYARAQEFALDLHLWPDLNKATGDAYLGKKDYPAARIAYRHAQKPREGEGSEDDPDTWARIGRAYYLGGKEMFTEKGLLLAAIDELNAAEGDVSTTTTVSAAPGAAAGGAFPTAAGTGVVATTATTPIADPTKWDGYARALYVAGINKKARLQDMQAPKEPDPVIANVFAGLGELYLFQADTYQTNPTRGIKSHTYDEAIEMFDKALLFDPNCIPALLNKATAYVNRAERADKQADKLDGYTQAVDIIQNQALKVAPNDAGLWAALAKAYLGLDELDKAEAAVTKALTYDRKNLTALNVDGLVKYYRNQCVDAANAFTRAVEAAPTDFPSHLNLANAYYGMRSWARAQREYESALQLIPQISIANTGSERPYVKYLIARAQHELRMYDKAVTTLSETLSLRPDFYWAQRLLAASYSGLEQWRAAEEALRSALKSAPPDDFEKLADTHAHLGEVFEVQGRVHEAIAEYRVALSYSPACLKASDGLRRLSTQEKSQRAAVDH